MALSIWRKVWGGEDSDLDDPAYKYESEEETDELYSGGLHVDDASDEEFTMNKENYKSVKDGMKYLNYSKFDFDSDKLRSIGSSSEDENKKTCYVGPLVIKKKRELWLVLLLRTEWGESNGRWR